MRLQDVLDNRNKQDLLIFTGDMNAKVGEENWDYVSSEDQQIQFPIFLMFWGCTSGLFSPVAPVGPATVLP